MKNQNKKRRDRNFIVFLVCAGWIVVGGAFAQGTQKPPSRSGITKSTIGVTPSVPVSNAQFGATGKTGSAAAKEMPRGKAPSVPIKEMPFGGIQSAVAIEENPVEKTPDVALEGKPGGHGLMDIKDLVRKNGVTYELANKYDASVVPILLEMLEDPAEEDHWPDIVGVLATVGDERAVDPLLAFIEREVYLVDGKMSQSNYFGKVRAITGLAGLVDRTGSEKALNYLKEGVNPEIWESRIRRGIGPFQDSMAERNMSFSIDAIIGLGLSGNSSAAETLRSLQEPVDTETKRVFQSRASSTVSEALKSNKEISSIGATNFYRKDRQGSPTP